MVRFLACAAVSCGLAAGGAGLSGAAHAESAGQAEYMNSCASCHGADGRGKGPMIEYLSVSPPALTGLAEANGGVFPMGRVIEVIDGRRGVRGHGSEQMPIWGAVYSDPTQEALDPEGARMAVRGRILSLAYFLEGIQD